MPPSDLAETRRLAHRDCVVCSSSNPDGLGVNFEMSDDGGVKAVFRCEQNFEGYRGLIHGGVISSLLDGAMTNCVFSRGHVAVTAELRIRFKHPVVVGPPATIRAWIDRQDRSIYFVAAELTQNGEIKATAEGKFLNRRDLTEMFGKATGSATGR
jgi:uncharacterized protein (TIGR00369 family)